MNDCKMVANNGNEHLQCSKYLPTASWEVRWDWETFENNSLVVWEDSRTLSPATNLTDLIFNSTGLD